MFKKLVLLVTLTASMTFTATAAKNAEAETHAAYVQLRTQIDVKTAKAGDYVYGTLRESVRLNSGSRLPSGALVTGHIVSVSGSSFSLIFDHVQIPGQKPLSISVVVRRIENAPVGTDDPDEDSAEIKSTGDPVSKVHGIVIGSPTDASNSALVSGTGKSVHLDYGTLLGCIVSM